MAKRKNILHQALAEKDILDHDITLSSGSTHSLEEPRQAATSNYLPSNEEQEDEEEEVIRMLQTPFDPTSNNNPPPPLNLRLAGAGSFSLTETTETAEEGEIQSQTAAAPPPPPLMTTKKKDEGYVELVRDTVAALETYDGHARDGLEYYRRARERMGSTILKSTHA